MLLCTLAHYWLRKPWPLVMRKQWPFGWKHLLRARAFDLAYSCRPFSTKTTDGGVSPTTVKKRKKSPLNALRSERPQSDIARASKERDMSVPTGCTLCIPQTNTRAQSDFPSFHRFCVIPMKDFALLSSIGCQRTPFLWFDMSSRGLAFSSSSTTW